MNSKFVSFKQNTTLYMNHLLVVYAFLLPISQRALSTIFTLILILFIIRGNFKYYLSYSLNNKIVQACFIYFAIHILWMFGSDNIESAKSVVDDMKYLLFPILFLSFLDKTFSYRVLSAFILGMFFSEIVSYSIYFDFIPYKLEIYNYEIYEAQAATNPTPFLIHSRYNVFISIVVAILLYNLLKNFSTNSKVLNAFSILFIVTASYNITITGGRIGYISFFFLIFTVLFFIYKKKVILSIVPAILILISFFYMSYQKEGMFKSRVDQTITSIKKISSEEMDLNSSIGYRVSFWISSYSVIKDNFFFGVGTGDQLEAVRLVEKDETRKRIADYLNNTHNEYLKIILQFGFIGLCSFLYIIYQVFKTKTQNELDIKLLYLCFIGVLIGLLSSTFGSKVYLPFLMLMISVFSTTNNHLKYLNKEINFRTILTYILFSVFLYIYVIVQ